MYILSLGLHLALRSPKTKPLTELLFGLMMFFLEQASRGLTNRADCYSLCMTKLRVDL